MGASCSSASGSDSPRAAAPANNAQKLAPAQIPNYEGAFKLVFEQLQKLNKNYFYHDINHTFRDVVPTSELIAKEEGCTAHEVLLVKTAALFHDTGFLDQYDKNEPFGAERARKHLPEFGYSNEDIEIICRCIMATQVPPTPGDFKLAQIVCDADLAQVCTELCFLNAEALRVELKRVKGVNLTPLAWAKSTLEKVKGHTLFTEGAKKLLEEGRLRNIVIAEEILQNAANENK